MQPQSPTDCHGPQAALAMTGGRDGETECHVASLLAMTEGTTPPPLQGAGRRGSLKTKGGRLNGIDLELQL
jgi:hypothetical protein